MDALDRRPSENVWTAWEENGNIKKNFSPLTRELARPEDAAAWGSEGSRWSRAPASQELLVPVLTVGSECCAVIKKRVKLQMPLKDRLIQ